ncbi:lysozyme [Sphingomonas sp.]
MAIAVIGAAGASLIKESEGVRYKTYLDPVGIPTACYGHTGPNVRLGQTYTKAQCDALFMQDVDKHQVVIRPGHPQNCIGHRRLTQNQNDAVLSLAFNIGNGAFCRSTLARRLTSGDMAGAANEFPKWRNVTINGKLTPLNGLIKRRERERQLFLTPSAPAARKATSEAVRAISG